MTSENPKSLATLTLHVVRDFLPKGLIMWTKLTANFHPHGWLLEIGGPADFCTLYYVLLRDAIKLKH